MPIRIRLYILIGTRPDQTFYFDADPNPALELSQVNNCEI